MARLAHWTSASTQADMSQRRPHLCIVLQALPGCAVPRPMPLRAAGIADILAAPAVAGVVARTLSAPAHEFRYGVHDALLLQHRPDARPRRGDEVDPDCIK